MKYGPRITPLTQLKSVGRQGGPSPSIAIYGIKLQIHISGGLLKKSWALATYACKLRPEIKSVSVNEKSMRFSWPSIS